MQIHSPNKYPSSPSSSFPLIFSIPNLSPPLFRKMDSQFHLLMIASSIKIDRKTPQDFLVSRSPVFVSVTAVDSPNKALELLGLNGGEKSKENELGMKVNMIITDYSMPGMTGYDLLRRIKASEKLKDIPVVIMSSEYIPARINRCLEDGADEFFLKPVRLSDVDKLKPHMLRSKANKDFCKFYRLLNWYSENAQSFFQRCV
ncbi:LOW QUALITY PROTEIN: hypothetical protein Cgig2_009888 [Carnegiea gigantea]|uniref:Response regulatory domain-containing protein n=1 Tax=Carnegiea gigantea TaxID=171969 RepID=A0A9Q1K8D6_9CARY|nr:LOW QUALITY PROTEIN: hypothetical protein Cgig2_009888 [Carnegiea gigantea]